MSEPRSEESIIRYYCTAGNGMERFLIDEVKKKLSAKDVCQKPGKVLFSSSAGMDTLIELKSAERLFLLIKEDSPVQLSAHISPAKATSVLQSKLLGDKIQWTSALMTWSRLQGELTNKRRTVNATLSALGVSMKKEEERHSKDRTQEEEKCNVKSTKSTGEQRDEEDRRLGNDEQNGKQAHEKKNRDKEETGAEGLRETQRKWEEEKNRETSGESETIKEKRKRNEHDDKGEEGKWGVTQDSCKKNIKKRKTSEKQQVEEEEEEGGIAAGFNSFVNKGEHAVTSGIKLNPRDDRKEYSVSNEDKEKMYGVRDPTHLESSCIKPGPPLVPVSFRINCKCTGSLSRYFSTQEVSRVIGVGLNRLMGWKSDLKNPELEVNVYLSDDYCLLGIPLTRLPLANRSYIKTTGLRSTVAWAMASLAQIQPGFCVVDPMCGGGTILIEAAREHKAACFLGMDIDDGQLQRANENIEFSEMGNRIHLLKASALALPLPSASVDAIVCDLPFGKKFGTKTDMAANLPLILTEMERVLSTGGSLVLLLSPQLSCLLKKFLAQKETGLTPNHETNSATGTKDCPSSSQSSTKQETSQINQGVNPPQSGLTHCLCLSSLKHQATFRVSLGVIDGLILKYVKMET
ncbi:THUMP domain-containing protein 2 [Notolabrus celidotus]|uniref:THUMP domain-containing protein 2 n=1 Tax=Notolabrus celidotus TaxID=1203425 RepID=UPI00148F52DA|nr:THUMP domain-containing protein 2 [Notolabrus celidotus]